ncbi:DUF421 domain-containing protein [Oxalicibacterium flavum]|uniref:DUF421 domain-containing protein n=2 Tax=Oxalicibacterium flavum TaxID=179467 RepID=A0A8J2XWZ2_9BURK|nr:DUF421 domain-containing protein [Oxalicibacterium flavum]
MMTGWSDLDWNGMFGMTVPFAEILIRGTVMYWLLFLIFRFLIPRDVGGIGIADILILVIIADAAQNAMSGDYKSVTDGALLVGVLVAWNMFFDRLSYFWPAFRRFSTPPSLCLVSKGKLMRRNMRREFITEDELWEHLRREGVDSLDQVESVRMESDGGFSVLKRKDART